MPRFILVATALLLSTQTVFGWEILPEKAPEPADSISSPSKIELGKKLYFDTRLSKTNKISCNSCHNVMGSGTDNAPFSTGINNLKGGRNSPTVWNSAFSSVQFWDGRAATLEDQAKGPMVNPVEMGMENHQVVIAKLSKIPEYVKEFQSVFGGKDSLTIDNVAKAIAAYERTLITPNSDYDKFLKGDKKALNTAAQRGMKLVQNMGCVSCHSGPHFSGPTMPIGQGFYMKFPTFPNTAYDKKYQFSKDWGRYDVTKNENEKNYWRVPTWRNVALTAPYFHNGSVKTLDEAVQVMAQTQLGKKLNRKEVSDIVAFLKSLTGELPKQTAPELPKD